VADEFGGVTIYNRLKEGLSVHGLTKKITFIGFIALLLLASAGAQATVNPFKKTKDLSFGPGVAWYEHQGAVIKSGAERDGADTNYYHVNINPQRLLLRLGRNDPSGELQDTRSLPNLDIVDVLLDGQRLPQFDWCLNNQQTPGRMLKQNAVVINDICVNAGGGGDFIIRLDEQSKTRLNAARTLSFIIEPYGRPVRLDYSMAGFSALMEKVARPEPVQAAQPVAPPRPAVKAPVPKPVAKPKPVKMCSAKPPADFSSAISAISYPCNDNAKKQDAEQRIAKQVAQEKQKMAQELQRAREEELARQQAIETEKRAAEWQAQQDALWIKRCQRHWEKGTSPCYCEKYLDQAPPGVTNTCGE
jgi:hypothetical protein